MVTSAAVACCAACYVLMALAETLVCLIRIRRWPGARECAVFVALSSLWPLSLANRTARRVVAWLREWAFDVDRGGLL